MSPWTPAHRPAWMDDWCRRELGSTPRTELLLIGQMSLVVGLELADGRRVVVKARPDEGGRVAACVATQLALAEAGLPVARPLTPVVVMADGTAVHAEDWRPGGEIRRGDDETHARASARALARFTAATAGLVATVGSPEPGPVWVRWPHEGPGLWSAYEPFDERALRVALPGWLDDVARRVRHRLAAAHLPTILGHADWETQNLRWAHDELHTVHDWDSLTRLAEAEIVGAASGAFASAEVPTLASVATSAAFLDAYQQARGRVFTAEETEVAWAASIAPAAHNARGETLHGSTPVAVRALAEQADERLRLARA